MAETGNAPNPEQLFAGLLSNGDREVAQHIAFQFELFKAVFHDIAKTDDALEFALVDHGKMTHMPVCHQRHGLLDRVGGRNRDQRLAQGPVRPGACDCGASEQPRGAAR